MRATLLLPPVLAFFALSTAACPPIAVNAPPDAKAEVAQDVAAEVESCDNDSQCDDGNSCTTDRCDALGSCTNTPLVEFCKIGDECFQEGQENPIDRCLVCDSQGGDFISLVCDDENPCTDDSCDSVAGCEATANDALPCDDGLSCSTDDACVDGACVGNCVCQNDSDCAGESVGPCEKAVCSNSVCTTAPDTALNGSACSGDDPCIVDATCAAGVCEGGVAKDCSGNSDDCNIGICNAASGECQPQPLTDGTPCDQGNECSTASCLSGSCDVVPNTLQECTPTDSCVVNAKCTDTAECKGTFDSGLSGCNCVQTSECDDGIACTTEICTAGECIYELQFDACLIGGFCATEGTANPENPCQSCNTAINQTGWTVVTCTDDGDPCTNENCNSASGACESVVAPGANCDDGEPCTESDLCDAGGACAGSAKSCDDGNPCTTDSCDPTNGACVNTITAGTACDAPCVVGGICSAAGVCEGTTLNCNDDNPCTIDTCDVGGGSCLNTPDVGKDCVADGDPCTTDRCTAAGTCAAQTVIANCELYSTEFDCGAGDWAFNVESGAVSWAVDNTVNPPGFWSANCSLNFNNDYLLQPNYFSPHAASRGTATGPTIDASDAQSLWVNMYQYWDTEEFPGLGNVGGYEHRALHVSTDGFETFKIFTDVGHRPENRNKWFIHSIDLSEFAGEPNVQLRFWFDTIDSAANNGAGWFIDDLTVSPAKASTPAENCGNSVDDDFDGLIDCDDPNCYSVCAKPADTCPTASPLGAAPNTVVGNFSTLSNTLVAPYACPGGGLSGFGPEAVHQFTPPANGNYRFVLGTIGSPGRLAIVTDCENASNTCIAGFQAPSGQSATLTVPLEGGTTYRVIAESGSAPGGPYSLTVQLAAEFNCTDGIDNDGDGGTDCLDIECNNAPTCRPEFECGDGEDNDGDGHIDCADSDCPCVETECADGTDDDLDGATDCDDTDCNSFCLEGANCGDGIDNDGDGFTDCQDVGDCGAASPCLEQGNCADGVDNDNDGDVDCDDSDCSAAACDESTQCSDGLDNDGDALTDCADADCDSSPACQETNNCNDYIDNDGDGAFDCDDSQCVGNFACTEVCNDGVDNDKDGQIDCSDSECTCEESSYAQCHDGKDNDLDNAVDCEDTQCAAACNEANGSNCGNGLDDDGNGTIDCEDPACNGSSYCIESGNCFDGKDNDGNGAIDCADAAACGSLSSCQEDLNCSDGQDNDKDGQYDCQDSDCAGNPSCANTCSADQDCDDGNPCTFDDCSFGICRFTAGVNCCSEAAQCNDGNACTTDSCSSAGGGFCQFAPKAASGIGNVIDYDFEAPVPGLAFSNSAGACGWQLADLGTAQSGDQVLYYGDPLVGNYNCGGLSSSGSATTEAVTVPVGATIGFQFIADVETDPYDQLRLLFISGGEEVLVWQKLNPVSNWQPVGVDAANIFMADTTSIEGKTGQFRFVFDTTDEVNNETLGVLIDDFIVGDPCN